jgi:hypothetical protein
MPLIEKSEQSFLRRRWRRAVAGCHLSISQMRFAVSENTERGAKKNGHGGGVSFHTWGLASEPSAAYRRLVPLIFQA